MTSAHQSGPSSTAVFPGILPWHWQGSCLYRFSVNTISRNVIIYSCDYFYLRYAFGNFAFDQFKHSLGIKPMTLQLLAQLFGLQKGYQDAAICLSKCLVTFHHASWFEEHPFFTPLAVQQLPQFLSRRICLGGPSENSHHHQDKVLKSHGQ